MVRRPRNTIEIDVSSLIKPTRLFVEETIETANEHGFRVILKDTPLLYADGNKKFPIQGWFDDEIGALATACRKKPQRKWLGVLAHEGCHLDQYVEGYPGWNKTSHSIYCVDSWIEHKRELSPHVLHEHIKRIQKLEHDCERRTAKKIIKHDLPIDVEMYNQQSNAYVFFYTAVERLRKWCRPGHSPASNPNVWKTMPKYLLPLGEYQQMSPKMLELYRTTM